MKFSALLCLAIVATAAAQYSEEDDVLILNAGNFDQAARDFKYLLVEFCKSSGMTYGYFLWQVTVCMSVKSLAF